jgi:hypothetical protein
MATDPSAVDQQQQELKIALPQHEIVSIQANSYQTAIVGQTITTNGLFLRIIMLNFRDKFFFNSTISLFYRIRPCMHHIGPS